MSLRVEIAEQPRVVRRLLEEGWPEARALGHALSRVEHITLVARGSSDNAATYGKYLFESIAGVVTRSEERRVGKECCAQCLPRCVVTELGTSILTTVV